jgi:hypothetical protein
MQDRIGGALNPCLKPVFIGRSGAGFGLRPISSPARGVLIGDGVKTTLP